MSNRPDTTAIVANPMSDTLLAQVMRRVLTDCDGDYVEAYTGVAAKPEGHRITIDGRWRITRAEFEAIRDTIEVARSAGVTTLAGWSEQ